MMQAKNFDIFLERYKAYRDSLGQDIKDLYQYMAQHGQSVGTMVITCADSRLDPNAIFGAKPGDLFVLRSVANLIPPHTEQRGRFGTAAAIQFAITVLEISHVLIMGHSQCGGVAACMSDHSQCHDGELDYIQNWVTLGAPARDRILSSYQSGQVDDLEKAAEQEFVRLGMERIKDFPFVLEAIRKKKLQVHGGWFDIKAAELYMLDPTDNKFKTV